MEIDISLYRIFAIVANSGSISKAAEKLYVSQSAVTQSIKKLEDAIGDKLFFRTKQGVELTDSGRTIYDYIKDSIEILENAEKIYSSHINLEKGVLRIGGGNTLTSTLIVPPLINFVKKYPGIKVTMTNGFTDELVEQVGLGKLDVVALYMPYKGKSSKEVEYTELRNSTYALFVSNEYNKVHPVKSMKDLKNHSMILPKKTSSRYKIYEEALKGYEINEETNYETASSAIIKKLVLAGCGVGFASTESLKDIMDKIHIIKEFNFDMDSEAVATLKKNKQNIITKEFLKELKNYYLKK